MTVSGRRDAQTAESKRRILEATLDVAAENGFAGTTVAKVVKVTDLPASSIYWHFGNKDLLLAEAIRYSHGLLRKNWPHWPPDLKDLPLESAVLELIQQALAPKEDRYLRLGLMLLFEVRDPEPLARTAFMDLRRDLQERCRLWWDRMLEREGWSGGFAGPHTMMRLTFAVLDACYVASDTLPGDIDAQPLLALMLANQCRHLIANPGDAVEPRSEPVHIARRTEVPAELSGRERLIEAAEQVVREQGLEGSTVAKICRRADLPASSLYWFFENKDELVAEVVATGYEAWARAADWDPVEPGKLWSSQNRWMRKSLAVSAASPDIFRIGHMLLLKRQAGPARDAFLEIRNRFADARAKWFMENIHVDAAMARDLSWTAIIYGDGVLIQQAGDPRCAASDLAPVMAAGLRALIEQVCDV